MVFMFFVAGKGRGSYEKAEIEKMQAAHLDNMRKRYEDGVLKLAGPCADPEKQRRGIVLLDRKDPKTIGKHFVEDPFVEHGLLTIEAMRVTAPMLDLGKPEETGIEQHTFALFQAPEHNPKAQAGIAPYTRMAAADRPAVAIVADGPGKLRMILIFREKDVEKVKQLIATDPAVVKGDLKADVWQQWLGKGALAPVK